MNPSRRPVGLLHVPRREGDMQVYMQSFGEAWLRAGGTEVPRRPAFRRGVLKVVQKALLFSGLCEIPTGEGKIVLVPSRGGHLVKSSLPYGLGREIVPMLWDCWPDTWPGLERALRRLRVRLCFVTASAVADRLAGRLPGIEFVHVPEGVDPADYSAGPPLAERPIDVYELGRRHRGVHEALMRARLDEACRMVCAAPGGRKGLAAAYPTWRGYCAALAATKITLSFPRSMTDAACAAVETMTMRYFEAMLSGCLIVGHAPRELVELAGYDPVVEMDMADPAGQLRTMLADIGRWQPLVDRNLRRAREIASWDARMPALFRALRRHGYEPVGKL